MSYAGRPFFNKTYKEAHPEIFWQHRGKGRWYPVDAEEATVPPPVQALRKFKAEKKTPSSNTDNAIVPKEPKQVRKRPAATDLEDQPVLKATRTRNGSARNAAIVIDEQTTTTPAVPNGGSINQEQTIAATAADDIPDEILVAPAKSLPKTTTKAKPKAMPKKKAPAPPKPRTPPRTLAALLKLRAPTTQGLHQETAPAKQAEMDNDFEEMGITAEALAARRPEPMTDAAMQITRSTATRQAEELAARLAVFKKKQAKRTTAARRAGGAAIPLDSTQISLDEGGPSTHWVLFDPRHGFPPILAAPPAIFERLARYQPGNRRIIAYNTESFSVALRKIPAFFEGSRVECHPTGLKLVKARGDGPAIAAERIDSPLAGMDAGGDEDEDEEMSEDDGILDMIAEDEGGSAGTAGVFGQ